MSVKEAGYLLGLSKAWMLRNIYDWVCGYETNFWAIINDTHREIEDLPSKTRNQIRRCLKDCDIKRLTNEELIKYDGYNVYEKSFERYQHVTVKIDERKHLEMQLSKNKTTEIWGVFIKDTGILIAWAIN